MTLLPEHTSPLEDVWVSLDLETTGLSPDGDEIIEVGAIKFQGERTLDTFETFVNPYRPISPFIQRYTGIPQHEVDRAPPFSEVARELAPFIGAAPIVGHNIAFDLGFLATKGLKLSNPRCDTWDMAFILLPASPEYSLAKVATSLGIPHPRPHRALEDARVTMDLFLRLAHMAAELDVFTLAEMERLASRSSWVLSYLLKGLESAKTIAESRSSQSPPPSSVGVMGLDTDAIKERLHHAPTLRPRRTVNKIDVDRVASMLSHGGPLSKAMPDFEERPEQIAMARAVAHAINEGKRLVVEAGTGVGKSLAYLLPAALYALANNKRIVVSTNTINLQEQLLAKDVPTLVKALGGVEGNPVGDFRYSQLKGRANYLCLKRWHHLRSGDTLSEAEARLLSKVLLWLPSTATGDKGELNLAFPKAAAPWERLSAQGAMDCTGVNGVCFLRAARDRAAAAHLVVVNHALLMSDLTASRGLIPDYDILIIDEAHHLEEEATSQLGFELGHARFDEHLRSLGSDGGLLSRAAAAFRGASAAETRRRTVEEVGGRIAALLPDLREAVAAMFGVLGGLLHETANGGSLAQREARVTPATRAQPGWAQIEAQWENADVLLAQLHKELAGLASAMEGLEETGLIDYDALLIEVNNATQLNGELRQRMAEVVAHPESDVVYWTSQDSRTGYLTLHAAPLHVGHHLEKLLFGQKESVILTGATLSANATFEHLRERTSFNDADELLLGSPFDYPRAALLCVPEDIPEPRSPAYQDAVQRAIADSAVAAGGRTMALFTSHASLQAAAAAIRGDLQAEGIDVLAQGIDGTPHQLVGSFLDNPSSVLLGTASFWEGVDLAGESLKVLLVARLPFNVPTEPVFEARSELYESPFGQYALPQAILRIRQGFGRLIRTGSDRGVVVILDRRVVSRSYGDAILKSLPPVSLQKCRTAELGEKIKSWLGT